MAIALVSGAHITAGSGSSNGFTTAGINTTGCDFLILAALTNATPIPTPTDSRGLTWNALTERAGSFTDRFLRFWWALPAGNVGSGHTFSITGSGNFPSLAVAGFSGVHASSPFDAENFGANGFSNTVQVGSIAPAGSNELFVAVHATFGTDLPTINSSYTIIATLNDGGFGHDSIQIAYKISSATENPTFSWTNANRAFGIHAAFKEAAGGGGGGTTYSGCDGTGCF